MRHYWLPILICVVAVAIPIVPLFTEPPTDSSASGSSAAINPASRSLEQTDNEGNVWVLSMAGGPSLFGFRKPGPPITVKTDVRKVGDVVSIGLVLQGRAGEKYRPTVKKNGATKSAPGLRIVDKRGNVIVEDLFAYG